MLGCNLDRRFYEAFERLEDQDGRISTNVLLIAQRYKYVNIFGLFVFEAQKNHIPPSNISLPHPSTSSQAIISYCKRGKHHERF